MERLKWEQIEIESTYHHESDDSSPMQPDTASQPSAPETNSVSDTGANSASLQQMAQAPDSASLTMASFHEVLASLSKAQTDHIMRALSAIDNPHLLEIILGMPTETLELLLAIKKGCMLTR
jgi:hypothetical protein